MSNKSISFETEHRSFVYLFCALVSLACLPVMATHYWRNLEGFGLLAIAGLMLTDLVMWFAGHWSVKTRSAAMRAVSLVTKFGIAAVMVTVAACCIMLMRSEHSADHLVEQQSKARAVEIEARAKAAKELAATPGGRDAARELARMSDGKTAADAMMTARADLGSKIPAWVTDYGLYVIPPIVAILGAVLLTITATVIKAREAAAEQASSSGAGNVLPFPDADAEIVEKRRRANFDIKAAGPDIEPPAIKGKAASMPGKSRTDKSPPAPAGFEFSPQARGFVCRRVTVENGKRKRSYIAYLNKSEWERMRSAHTGADLKAAVKTWIHQRLAKS